MFSIRVDGKIYDGFTKASYENVAENLCDIFRGTCGVDEGTVGFPIKRGADADIMIDNMVVSKAQVELVRVSAPVDGYTVTVMTRDKTKSILKSDLSTAFTVKGPVSLQRIIELVFLDVNVSFEIVDEVGDLEDFTKKEIATADVGGNAWDFIQKMAEKKQVIVSKSRDGKVVIRRGGEKKYLKKLLRLKNDPRNNNNIVSSEGESSDSERRAEYNVVGQENLAVKRDEKVPVGNGLYEPDLPSDTEEESDSGNPVLDQLNEALRNAPPGSELEYAIDKQIAEQFAANVLNSSGGRNKKKKFKRTRNQTLGVAQDELATDGVCWEKADTPCSDDDCLAIAKRRLNDSRVASVTYQCEVSDFIADDEPWEAGWLVEVVDEWCDVSAVMMIRRAMYEDEITEDGDPVSTCQIQMTIPDAYGVEGGASDSEKQVTVIGEKFNLGDLIV